MLPELSTIKTIRTNHGISQKKFAKECGISGAMLNLIESKKAKPSYDTAKKIFEYLDKIQYKNQKKAGEICARPVFSLKKSNTLGEAIREMKKREISQIPILDGNICEGMITEDGIIGINPESFDRSTRLVRILESEPPIVSANHPANPLKFLIGTSKCILVSEKGKITGIITSQDLHKLIA